LILNQQNYLQCLRSHYSPTKQDKWVILGFAAGVFFYDNALETKSFVLKRLSQQRFTKPVLINFSKSYKEICQLYFQGLI
jgi:hypothetical protein